MSDTRKKIVSKLEINEIDTHDILWNAAQSVLVYGGKMHSYVRMYWCKTLLRWFEDPREALKVAIELNDKYSIDGNDPNGYLGIMWCICGSMDRAFKEKDIFGKIRSMKSFKAKKYIERSLKLNK